MQDKPVIDGIECRYWFRVNPRDYRKCSLRGENDNCDEIKDCFIKELLGKLALKEQECEKLKIEVEKWESAFTLDTKMLDNADCRNNELEQQLDQLKAENDLYKNAHKTEQDRRRSYENALAEIKEIAEPYKMTIKKICGNCKKYDDCHACCYKDINCYKYTSSETSACEEFTYLDEFIPNLLANSILQKISEVIK